MQAIRDAKERGDRFNEDARTRGVQPLWREIGTPSPSHVGNDPAQYLMMQEMERRRLEASRVPAQRPYNAAEQFRFTPAPDPSGWNLLPSGEERPPQWDVPEDRLLGNDPMDAIPEDAYAAKARALGIEREWDPETWEWRDVTPESHEPGWLTSPIIENPLDAVDPNDSEDIGGPDTYDPSGEEDFETLRQRYLRQLQERGGD